MAVVLVGALVKLYCFFPVAASEDSMSFAFLIAELYKRTLKNVKCFQDEALRNK